MSLCRPRARDTRTLDAIERSVAKAIHGAARDAGLRTVHVGNDRKHRRASAVADRRLPRRQALSTLCEGGGCPSRPSEARSAGHCERPDSLSQVAWLGTADRL